MTFEYGDLPKLLSNHSNPHPQHLPLAQSDKLLQSYKQKMLYRQDPQYDQKYFEDEYQFQTKKGQNPASVGSINELVEKLYRKKLKPYSAPQDPSLRQQILYKMAQNNILNKNISRNLDIHHQRVQSFKEPAVQIKLKDTKGQRHSQLLSQFQQKNKLTQIVNKGNSSALLRQNLKQIQVKEENGQFAKEINNNSYEMSVNSSTFSADTAPKEYQLGLSISKKMSSHKQDSDQYGSYQQADTSQKLVNILNKPSGSIGRSPVNRMSDKLSNLFGTDQSLSQSNNNKSRQNVGRQASAMDNYPPELNSPFKNHQYANSGLNIKNANLLQQNLTAKLQKLRRNSTVENQPANQPLGLSTISEYRGGNQLVTSLTKKSILKTPIEQHVIQEQQESLEQSRVYSTRSTNNKGTKSSNKPIQRRKSSTQEFIKIAQQSNRRVEKPNNQYLIEAPADKLKDDKRLFNIKALLEKAKQKNQTQDQQQQNQMQTTKTTSPDKKISPAKTISPTKNTVLSFLKSIKDKVTGTKRTTPVDKSDAAVSIYQNSKTIELLLKTQETINSVNSFSTINNTQKSNQKIKNMSLPILKILKSQDADNKLGNGNKESAKQPQSALQSKRENKKTSFRDMANLKVDTALAQKITKQEIIQKAKGQQPLFKLEKCDNIELTMRK